jgi:hypothetical protein
VLGYFGCLGYPDYKPVVCFDDTEVTLIGIFTLKVLPYNMRMNSLVMLALFGIVLGSVSRDMLKVCMVVWCSINVVH